MAIEVEAHITGTIWKVETTVGAQVSEGDILVIIESMKMEMPVEAPEDGKILEIRCAPEQSVDEGDVLIVME